MFAPIVATYQFCTRNFC